LIISVGIELVLGTRVKSADVRRKTLLTAAGETISYKILIIATGARVLELIFNRLIFILLLIMSRCYYKCILHIKGRSICPWENDRYAKDVVFH
jgi:NADPH-dependent 2,4-dienoyl-CoA reductase/sulfur reductase-like enzyme